VRLKTLEIKGFKSFADKTVINLDNQITGIVGPNGCGKSNIVDAIRWVIGEHKIRALRSDNLEDLVFNGSKSRNASGLAEVSLTFENTRNLLPTEYNTVTISRKFYKNGDSEYRLNDVSCRLKDITNLFMDTGVSSDSYAIIELGMVDDIIKDKDNSRRRMLEQAAGISIYKTRKKEAKLKLDATQQDLNRIEDLLFEIANNLRTLESQAKKAEKYLQIKGEYKKISIELVKASLEDFNGTYQTLTTQQQHEIDKILEFEAKIAAEDAALQKSKLELTEREVALQLMQKNFNALVAEILKLENDKSLSAQRIEHLKQLKSNTETFLKDAEKQTEELEKNINESEQKLNAEKEALVILQEKMGSLRTILDEKRANFDAQKAALDEKRKAQQQLQYKHFEAEKKVAVSDNTVANINMTLGQIANETTNRNNEIKIQTEKKEELLKTKELAQKEHDGLVVKKEEATQKILGAQATLETLRNSKVEENRKLDSKQNEYSLLKSLVDSFEGYPESIKYLHKNPEWATNAPLLSDVLDVKEEYRICIENYLEQYLNFYIVKDAQEAYSALQLLDRNKKGKAGFFILNEFANNTENGPQINDALAAISCVNIKEGYSNLVKTLLQNVWIAEDENKVIEGNSKAILISKNGKITRKNNSLNGGAIGLFEGNKVGRSQRLEKLNEQIAELKNIVTNLSTEITATQTSISGYNSELNEGKIQSLYQQLNNSQNQIVQAEGRIENFQQLITQNNTRVEQLQKQLLDTQESIKDAKADFEKLKAEMAAKQDEVLKSEQSFKVTEGEYNKASEEYYQQNVIFTRQQGRISELTNEITIRTNQLIDISEKIETSNKQLQQTITDEAQTDEQLKTLETNLLSVMERRSVDEKVLNETDQAFYIFRNEITARETQVNSERRKKEDAEGILNSIKEKLTDMKLTLSGMKERLQIEFKVDIDEVLKGPRETETPIDELNEESTKLRKRIENLGEVNPMAVEAYKEVKGRHDFIQEQKGDLVTAKESLMATIEEVENTANKKFLDTFNQVRENFVKVFQALFTAEDHCNLKLVDPENPSDTAIEIYAQPKGKRPSTITQLSGGEKTLTSTAFLFAIYLIKPAPFCVLDEVDAPLDDANVLKFTQMIRQFSDNSQFIIVTHNKQTMASVDVIYGVTMQEAGVSKLVPVDFRSLN
jgi:chromosome segregation protein